MTTLLVSTVAVNGAPTDAALGTTPTPGKRRDGAWVAAKQTDDAYDFASRFKVVINIARALGALPIYKGDTGWAFHVRTRVFAYSVLVYLVLLVLFVHVVDLLLDRNDAFSDSRSDFHHRVYNHMFIGLLSMYLMVPVTTWLDAPRLAEYVNEWNRFQTHYMDTVGSRLRIADTLWTQAAVSLGSVVFLGANLHLFALRELRFWEKLPHLVSMSFSAVSGCYWMLTSNAIVGAATQLDAAFLSALRTSESPHLSVHAYRRLWLALSRLTSATSASFALTSGLFTLTELYLIVLAVHGLLSSMLGLQQAFDSNVVYVMATACTVVAFYTFCNQGYRITEQVKNGILEALQTINTSECDCRTVREVTLFIQCVAANPPVLSLAGFVDVDRGLFKSCCATIFAYLVVIIQFDLGLNHSDGDGVAPSNATAGDA